MRINLVRAKNADLLTMIKSGDNILGCCKDGHVLDVVTAAAVELKRRGRDPQTGKRLTA